MAVALLVDSFVTLLTGLVDVFVDGLGDEGDSSLATASEIAFVLSMNSLRLSLNCVKNLSGMVMDVR